MIGVRSGSGLLQLRKTDSARRCMPLIPGIDQQGFCLAEIQYLVDILMVVNIAVALHCVIVADTVLASGAASTST